MEPTDVGRPSTWKPYRPALCGDCRAGCCTLPVEVSADDLVQMGLAAVDETRGSLKKLARRLMREGVVKSFRARSGFFTLEQHHNGDCHFLDERRRCRIYDKRPTVCRKFPLELGPRLGYCPHRSRKP
jgi:Fe-S-cluster containining protein